jgi:hypothetical protein
MTVGTGGATEAPPCTPKRIVRAHEPAARTLAERQRETKQRLEHDVDVWVATADPASGTPYLVPLSFLWDGATLLIATPVTYPTSQNLQTTGLAGSQRDTGPRPHARRSVACGQLAPMALLAARHDKLTRRPYALRHSRVCPRTAKLPRRKKGRPTYRNAFVGRPSLHT